MGLLRVLLALSVAVSHYIGHPFAASFTAVQMFYVISGFYMATILTEKYNPYTDIGVFFSNRLLRIYSVYFVCLIASLAAYYILYRSGRPGWFFEDIVNSAALIDWPGKLWLAFTTIFIFGQETTLFMKIAGGGLVFAPEGPVGSNHLWRLMAIPQAWSISLELMFYCLVPFLIRNGTRTLVAILAATLILRVVLFDMGYEADPWMSRSFPSELGLFILGMVAQRVYDAHIAKTGRIVQILVAISFLAATCFMWKLIESADSLRLSYLYAIWAYFFSALVALPCLFQLTRHNKFDGFIGNFSYPIYLIHWAVMIFYDAFAAELHWPVTGSWMRVAILIAISIVLAAIIIVSLEAPIDRYRQRRFAMASMRA